MNNNPIIIIMDQYNYTTAKSHAINMLKQKTNNGILQLHDAYDLLEMFDEDVDEYSEETALQKLKNALSEI